MAAFAVAVCLPMLAACGEDEKPEIKRAPASETPSASESPTASETPEPESPKAFIRRWQKASDKMQNTGNTKAYRKMATRFCSSCMNLADRMDEIYQAGGEVTFGGSTIVNLSRAGGSRQRPKFEMQLKTSKTTYVERAGEDPKSFTGGMTTYVIILQRRDDTWKIYSALQRPK